MRERDKVWKEGEGDDEHRHRCLVRWVIQTRLKDRDKAMKWLYDWQNKHNGSVLQRDVLEQWQKGNRGESGDWR